MAGGFPKKLAKWQYTLEDSVIPTCKIQEGLAQIANMVCGLTVPLSLQKGASFCMLSVYGNFAFYTSFLLRHDIRHKTRQNEISHKNGKSRFVYIEMLFAESSTLVPFYPSLFLNIHAANGMVTRVITTIGSKSGETAARDAPSI